MAIDINELETIKQKEADEKQRKEDELIGEQGLRELESRLDKSIKENYTREKMWFSKKTKIRAKFSFTDMSDAAEKIDVLIQRGLISAFLERYRQKDWVVHYWHGWNGLWLSFTKIIDLNIEPKSAIDNKKQRVAELKAEITQLEAEIQFLTESPNSRDPLLLPEIAGK